MLFGEKDVTPLYKESSPQPVSPITTKCRLTFSKQGTAKHLSHLELVKVFIRALRRAGVNVVHSKGYHPMPKLSFATALPVGTESMEETLDLELSQTSDFSPLKDRLNLELPPGIKISFVQKLYSNTKKPRLKESHFLVTLGDIELNESDLDKFCKTDHFPVAKRNRKGEHQIDAKLLVKSIAMISQNSVKIILRGTNGPELRPAELVKEIFSLKNESVMEMQTLKTGQVLA